MASAGWDEVLGGGAGAGDGGGPPDGPEDDGDGAPRKKRVKTSTKVFLVVAGWLLLTLFLVGQFSKKNAGPTAVARLDTTSQDGAASGEPEVVDSPEEEALDTDGDGFLSAEEQGLDSASASESGGGGSSGSSSEAATYEGTPGAGATAGSGGSTSGGSTGVTTPGAAPGGSTSGGGTATTTAGGGTGGGTTTTTKPGSTTTTTKGGGGSSSSTTTTTTAPSTTSTTAGNNVPSSVSTSFKGLLTGFDPDEVTVRLSNGSASVDVSNDSQNDRDFKPDGETAVKIKKGDSHAFSFTSAGDTHITVSAANGTKTLLVHVLA